MWFASTAVTMTNETSPVFYRIHSNGTVAHVVYLNLYRLISQLDELPLIKRLRAKASAVIAASLEPLMPRISSLGLGFMIARPPRCATPRRFRFYQGEF